MALTLLCRTNAITETVWGNIQLPGRLKNKCSEVILFECEELLCQISERLKDQGKVLPSDEEMIKLFKIALKNHPKEYTEFDNLPTAKC